MIIAYCPRCQRSQFHILMPNGAFVCKPCLVANRIPNVHWLKPAEKPEEQPHD
jgi:late competence protein required for DNA uptake (superfamily II DNA/RNA helicase)